MMRFAFPLRLSTTAITLWLLVTSGWTSAASDELAGRRLTTTGRLKRDPVFWPQTGELVFAEESPVTGGMRLMRLDLHSGSVTDFLPDEPAGNRELSVSSDGQVFAYNVVKGLSSRIHVVDNTRSLRITLPQMGKANWTNWPSVSPSGERVVFVEGARVLYEYNLAENRGKDSVRRLSEPNAGYSDYWPRYSPQGTQIVFASNRDGDFELYVMNADGTDQRRLTQSRGIDMHPAFSPDGKRVAFTSNRDGNYEIYVLDAISGNAFRVTRNPQRDDFACWHPSGQQLVIVSERDGQTDLYLLDLPVVTSVASQ